MNRLKTETSPYLRQHADNPVDWWPWGRAAFEEAARTNRPILLSVGYAACHWFHVMAHESFEDPATAALMNRLFVNIKVDREERPDVDRIYQTALALFGERGGWPLTIFLTPAGDPFWGGTYFPPDRRWGRPGFREVLEALSGAAREQPDRVAANAAQLRDGLARLATPVPGDPPGRAQVAKTASTLSAAIDRPYGGFGMAPKFPQAAALELLLAQGLRSSDPALLDGALLTLDRICQGGIYDHLGGGFARYATDRLWLVPHFEKMLYDNAQLIHLLILAWRNDRKPLWAERVAETIAWLDREMSLPGGGFAAALDADSEGEEGRFYVWQWQELAATLGSELDAFARAYDAQPDGNWEGRVILNRLAGGDMDEALMARCRSRLMAARDRRPRPARDDKVLADWTGLTIAALVEAGAAFDRPDWIARAIAAFDFVQIALIDPQGRPTHSWCSGRAAHPATLDDHAQMAAAGITLHEVTGDRRFLDIALDRVALADRHHRLTTGAHAQAADHVGDLLLRMAAGEDDATPSGNGTLARVLARLGWLTGDLDHHARARQVIRAFGTDLSDSPRNFPSLLMAIDLLEEPVQIVLVGEDPDGLARMRRIVLGSALPTRILTTIADGTALPANHPAFAKTPVNGSVTAYVCRNQTCGPPITDPAELKVLLEG